MYICNIAWYNENENKITRERSVRDVQARMCLQIATGNCCIDCQLILPKSIITELDLVEIEAYCKIGNEL